MDNCYGFDGLATFLHNSRDSIICFISTYLGLPLKVIFGRPSLINLADSPDCQTKCAYIKQWNAQGLPFSRFLKQGSIGVPTLPFTLFVLIVSNVIFNRVFFTNRIIEPM